MPEMQGPVSERRTWKQKNELISDPKELKIQQLRRKKTDFYRITINYDIDDIPNQIIVPIS